MGEYQKVTQIFADVSLPFNIYTQSLPFPVSLLSDVDYHLKVLMDNTERMSQTVTDVTNVLSFFSKSSPNKSSE